MRALVTGGAGFIGSNVADRLLAEGWHVGVLDNFDDYYDPAQKRRNVAAALRHERYRLFEGDVREAEQVDAAFDELKPEAVVHLAARAGVRTSVSDPVSYVQVNELGGLLVLDACRRRGGVPIVYASTSSVYGATSQIPFREDDAATEPLSPYAASKRGAELMAYAYWHIHQQPAAVLRFFTVYGPRGRPDMALHGFTEAILEGRPIRLHGEETERDFTYVDDIVSGVVGAIGWVVEGRGFGTFNLGRSEPIRVRKLIETLANTLGREARVVLGELMPGESRRTAASVERAAEAFGYRPEVSIEEGVRRWVEWYTTSPESPAAGRPQS